MNNDLINRSDLLKEVRENKELFEKERVYLEGLLLNAPTVELTETEVQEVLDKKCMTAVANEYLIALHGKTERPHFNRGELEKALNYWYEHLERHSEEQNEAAWCAINAIRYCIENSSAYQE